MSGHLGQLVRFWGRRFPDRLAVRFRDHEVTWGQLDADVDALAAGLSQRGVGLGAVVGIMMSNRYEFIETMLAVFRVGGTVALINTRLTPTELLYPVIDSGADLIVTESSFIARFAAVLKHPDAPQLISVDPAGGYIGLADLRRSGLLATAASSDPGDPEDIALLAYTSGTTGVPKGAMLSHRAIVANGLARSSADLLTWQDRVLCLMPLAFTGGASTFLREVVCTGASAFVESTFDPARVLDLLESERITTCSAVPVMWERMLELPNFTSADLSALRAGIAGGATTPLEVIRKWQDRGVGLRQGYGQTEFAGGFATVLYEDEAQARIGAVGRPIIGTRIRIVDEEDVDVPVGQAGEILLRGPSMMTGYWNKPDDTAQVLAGGWLHTGDVGMLDEDGYLRVIDRARDMLISGGFNVYPAELEKVLAGLPGLEELAVIGVPDMRWGEVPMLVVPNLEAIDVNELRSIIIERLADYRRPKWLVAHGADLPRTMSGKVLKRELRTAYPAVPHDAIALKVS
ncbi:class I adenylate-forming enzyme family protein [Mycolicibacterium sp. ELW1]|uniref:class I adenylate-forming enzyme family protein n=1 Tax=Mycobacteriaceae TaxID=1762 RepID=UPI002570E367|nr:AMP-binding protein [Mycobacterium sp. ELW1]